MADVDVTFGATLDDLLSSMTSAKDAIAEFGAGLAAAFSVRELGEFVKSMGELGLQTERVMATLGVSAGVVGELSGMAQLTGSDINSLALGIERLSLNVQRGTRDGINPMAQAMAALGLRAKELIGVSADVYIQRLADAANRFAPSLNLTNLLMEVGGRQAGQLVATLRLLGESFAENQAKINATGSVLNDFQARELAQTHEQITLLGLSMQGLGIAVFEAFEPAIRGVTRSLTDFVQWITNSIREGRLLGDVFSALGTAAKTVASTFAALLGLLKELTEAVSIFFHAAAGGLEDVEFMRTAGARMEAIARETADRIRDIWRPVIEVTKTAGGGLAAPGIDFGAAERMQAALASIGAEIKMAEDRYNSLKRIYADDAASHQISELQKYQLTVSALNQEWAAIQGFYGQEEAAAAGSPAKLAAVLAQQKVAYQKYYDELAKLAADYRKKNTEEWNKIGSEIQSAWDSQLRGLLAGTTTWAAAMKNVAGDLVLYMIKEFEKLLIFQPLFAAISGFLPAPSSLFALPFSAGPGITGIPTAQSGTDYVPRTGLAFLHAGEAVLPAAQNPSNPQATAPIGGGSLALHIHAVDAASFVSALRNANSGLSRELQHIMRQNPALLTTAANRYV